ncbi:MAG TPA: hydrogenase maturation nickel metallochaperone HypA [Syntrophales bacterium]|nr:hydrogenase maturation nickel metallochaperone HypA [Syntrophales bacterium]
MSTTKRRPAASLFSRLVIFSIDICYPHVIDFRGQEAAPVIRARQMHELSVTESILNIVLKHAQTNRAERVLSIGLRIGELSELVGECIQHYFDYLSKGTIAEGAALEIERSPIMFECTECKCTFQVSLSETKDFTCTRCHSAKVKLVSGREFYIKDITIS